MSKARYYKTRKGAEKRMRELEAQWPDRAFAIVVDNQFRFCVGTKNGAAYALCA